jgi:hypothetical protein
MPVRAVALATLAAVLTMGSVTSTDPAQAVSARPSATVAGNGSLGFYAGRRDPQRMDSLDGGHYDLWTNVGPGAAFNRTGDQIVSYRGGVLTVVHANGVVHNFAARSLPEATGGASLGAATLWWPDSGDFVVLPIVQDDRSTGGETLHYFKVVDGRDPVRLPDGPGTDLLAMNAATGELLYKVYDATYEHLRLQTFDPVAMTWGTPGPSWCTSGYHCEGTQADVTDAVWDPVSGEVLLYYTRDDYTPLGDPNGNVAVDYDIVHHERVGWYALGAAAPRDLFEVPEGRYGSGLLLSPDRTMIAWTHELDGNDATAVVRASDGSTVTELSGAHWGWQPCVGPCARFVEPRSPSRTPIKRARPGKKGGKRTAIVRWGTPESSGTTAINDYLLVATKVHSHVRKVVHRPARSHRYQWRLRKGTWRFRVCAYNSASPNCTVSKYSNRVKPR